jgi:hypothetical protein
MGMMNEVVAGQESKLDVLAESFLGRKDQIIYSSSLSAPELDANKLMGGDLLEGLDRYPDHIQRNTLVMLEQAYREFHCVDEATRLVNIGSFERFAYPLIRAIFPNLILQDIVSVQPMDGPTSLIFWMRFLYASTKGSVAAGTDMLLNPNEDYASELIDAEVLGTGTGAVANYAGTLAWTPVKPGTVTIVAGALTVTDDGNGNLVGDVNPAGANTIVYATGAYDVTFNANVLNGVDIVATYRFDMEANLNQPEIDMSIVSASIEAEPMTLLTRWSEFVNQDLTRLHGVSAETESVKALGLELKAQIEMRVINRIVANAALNGVAWATAPGAGVSQKEHYESFVTRLIENSNQITGATNRAYGNWLIASLEVCNVVEALAASGRFVPAPTPPTNVSAPHYIGMLDNRWKVFKHTRFAANTYLMGYRSSDNLYEVGHVYAPYLLLFASPTVKREHFQSSKGIGSRYGDRTVDANFYLNGTIV